MCVYVCVKLYRVGHSDDAAMVEAEALMELILERTAVYRFAILSGAGRIASLHDEVLHHPMKNRIVLKRG
jgi:hypothetical protein